MEESTALQPVPTASTGKKSKVMKKAISATRNAAKVVGHVFKVLFSVLFAWITWFHELTELRDLMTEATTKLDRYRFRDIKKTTKYKSFDNWTFPKGFCRALMESNFWNWFILVIIFCNAGIDGYCCDYEVRHGGEVPVWSDVVNVFFLSIYTIEFVMMAITHGFIGYIMNPWYRFDFVILVVCFIPYILESLTIKLNFLRTFRALRGMRVFRTVHFLPRLQTLFDAVMQTLFSALWLIVLLFIFILVFAIAALYCFGERVPDPWGNLATSLLHTFAITTKDAWNVYQDDLDREYGESSRVFSVFVVVVCGLIISSLVVAAVTDNFEDCANKNNKAIAKMRRQKVAAYREENKKKERIAISKRMRKARDHSANFEKDKEILAKEPRAALFHVESSDKNDMVKPQKSMFCNPKWMGASLIVMKKIHKLVKERAAYYQQLFHCLVDLSEIGATNSETES